MNAKKDLKKVKTDEIRKRANEIWKRKCRSLNTALDDWLEAERDFRVRLGDQSKKPSQYTLAEVAEIKTRAQAIRDEKILSLRTAFDDWIEAEKELVEELKNKKIDRKDLFEKWFRRASPRIAALLEENLTAKRSIFDQVLGEEYVEFMKECMG